MLLVVLWGFFRKVEHYTHNLTDSNKVASYHSLGITLTELLVTLAIGAILVALALPGFERFHRNNVLANSSNELAASLNRARAAAIKSRRNVRMCPTGNNTSCADSGSWADGWIMFVDTDGDDTPDSDELIRVGEQLDGLVTLTPSASFSQGVQYNPSGSVEGFGGVVGGSFSFCSGAYHEFSRQVGVAATGRVNARKQANLCVN